MRVSISNTDNIIDWGATDTGRIVQNVRNILMTKRFEIPFMRGLGIDPSNIDISLPRDKNALIEDITETIQLFENRVEVINVTIDGVDDNGNCKITVELEV